MNGRLVYHHLVETRRTSSIAIIESKRFGFSVFQALPQTLAYMMANPNPASPIFSLVTNGEDFLFVKLRSCTILNKWVSAARSAAETHVYRSRAERANGKCERCKI
jgi:hypothetical protein